MKSVGLGLDDLGAARVAVLLLQLLQVLLDERADLGDVGENLLQVGDGLRLTSASSSRMRRRSSAANRPSCISRMALACSSLNLKRVCRLFDAVSRFCERRIVSITASRLSRAVVKPSRMCWRASAFARSNFVRRVMTDLAVGRCSAAESA